MRLKMQFNDQFIHNEVRLHFLYNSSHSRRITAFVLATSPAAILHRNTFSPQRSPDRARIQAK